MFFRKVSQTMDIIQQKQNIRRMLALHQKTNTKVDNREKQKIKGMKKEMQGAEDTSNNIFIKKWN
jgi:hypothetical protein